MMNYAGQRIEILDQSQPLPSAAHMASLLKAAKRTIRAEVNLIIVVIIVTSWSIYALFKLATTDSFLGLGGSSSSKTTDSHLDANKSQASVLQPQPHPVEQQPVQLTQNQLEQQLAYYKSQILRELLDRQRQLVQNYGNDGQQSALAAATTTTPLRPSAGPHLGYDSSGRPDMVLAGRQSYLPPVGSNPRGHNLLATTATTNPRQSPNRRLVYMRNAPSLMQLRGSIESDSEGDSDEIGRRLRPVGPMGPMATEWGPRDPPKRSPNVAADELADREPEESADSRDYEPAERQVEQPDPNDASEQATVAAAAAGGGAETTTQLPPTTTTTMAPTTESPQQQQQSAASDEDDDEQSSELGPDLGRPTEEAADGDNNSGDANEDDQSGRTSSADDANKLDPESMQRVRKTVHSIDEEVDRMTQPSLGSIFRHQPSEREDNRTRRQHFDYKNTVQFDDSTSSSSSPSDPSSSPASGPATKTRLMSTSSLLQLLEPRLRKNPKESKAGGGGKHEEQDLIVDHSQRPLIANDRPLNGTTTKSGQQKARRRRSTSLVADMKQPITRRQSQDDQSSGGDEEGDGDDHDDDDDDTKATQVEKGNSLAKKPIGPSLQELLAHKQLLDALQRARLHPDSPPAPVASSLFGQQAMTLAPNQTVQLVHPGGPQPTTKSLAFKERQQPSGAAQSEHYTLDEGLLLYPAQDEDHEHGHRHKSKKSSKSAKKEEKKRVSVAVKKGGHKKKKHQLEEKKYHKEKKFKGAKKGKKMKKGKGGKGAKKGSKFYKDKGFKKKGFKNIYVKNEFGQKKSYFDEFRDKDFKKKWKNFDDKYNYAQMKKWQAKELKGAKKVKDHGEKMRKYDKGKWKKKSLASKNSESSKKKKKSSDEFR